jgi:hypothetical protein
LDTLQKRRAAAGRGCAGFEVLLTTDKNTRTCAISRISRAEKIAVVILGRQQWPGLQPYIHLVVEAVNAAQPGSYLEVSLPPVPKRGDPEHGS